MGGRLRPFQGGLEEPDAGRRSADCDRHAAAVPRGGSGRAAEQPAAAPEPAWRHHKPVAAAAAWPRPWAAERTDPQHKAGTEYAIRPSEGGVMAEDKAAAQPMDVLAGSDAVMVGTAFQNYQQLDGTLYTADANGVINVAARHVAALLTAGCQFKASGLPS